MFVRQYRHMFVFFANRTIPPTNNGSEQALRRYFRKISWGKPGMRGWLAI
jgi:hypothetical protein